MSVYILGPADLTRRAGETAQHPGFTRPRDAGIERVAL